MSNKTNVGYYNEDDFIEIDEKLRELTVTITLCEYRNLIHERTRNEYEIAKLQDELATAKKQVKTLQNLIFERMPDIKEKFVEIYKLIDQNYADEEASDTEDTEQTEEKEEGR